MKPSDYEYIQETCDVWQVANLIGHLADLSWEFMAVFPSHPGVKVPSRVSRPNETHYEAILPYEVLFRRPIEMNAEAGQ